MYSKKKINHRILQSLFYIQITNINKWVPNIYNNSNENITLLIIMFIFYSKNFIGDSGPFVFKTFNNFLHNYFKYLIY